MFILRKTISGRVLDDEATASVQPQFDEKFEPWVKEHDIDPVFTLEKLLALDYNKVDGFLDENIKTVLVETLQYIFYSIEGLKLLSVQIAGDVCRDTNESLAEIDSISQKKTKDLYNLAYNLMAEKGNFVDKQIRLMTELNAHLEELIIEFDQQLETLEYLFVYENTDEELTLDTKFQKKLNIHAPELPLFNSRDFKNYQKELSKSLENTFYKLHTFYNRLQRFVERKPVENHLIDSSADSQLIEFSNKMSTHPLEYLSELALEVKTFASDSILLVSQATELFSITSPSELKYVFSTEIFMNCLDVFKSQVEGFDPERDEFTLQDMRFELTNWIEVVRTFENQVNEYSGQFGDYKFEELTGVRELLIKIKHVCEALDAKENEETSEKIDQLIQEKNTDSSQKDAINALLKQQYRLCNEQLQTCQVHAESESKFKDIYDKRIGYLTTQLDSLMEELEETELEELKLISTEIVEVQESKEDSPDTEKDWGLFPLRTEINHLFFLQGTSQSVLLLEDFSQRFYLHIQALIENRIDPLNDRELDLYWDLFLKGAHLIFREHPSVFQEKYENPLQVLCQGLIAFAISNEKHESSPIFQSTLDQFDFYISQFTKDSIDRRKSKSYSILHFQRKIGSKNDLCQMISFSNHLSKKYKTHSLMPSSTFERACLCYNLFETTQDILVETNKLDKKNPRKSTFNLVSVGKHISKKPLQEVIDSGDYSSLENTYHPKTLRAHRDSDFCHAMNACIALFSTKKIDISQFELMSSFMRQQHLEINFKTSISETGDMRRILRLPHGTPSTKNGFYALYFLALTTATFTPEQPDKVNFRLGNHFMIKQRSRLEEKPILLSELCSVVTENLERQSIEARQLNDSNIRKCTLPELNERIPRCTMQTGELRLCSIQELLTETEEFIVAREGNLRTSLEDFFGSFSDTGFRSIVDTARQGKLNFTCLAHFDDQGYKLFKDYIYPLQLLYKTRTVLTSSTEPTQSLHTLERQLKFLRNPASATQICELMETDSESLKNQVAVHSAQTTLHLMYTKLGEYPFQSNQVELMLKPMNRTAQRFNHSEFIHQETSSGKSTMSSLSSNYTSMVNDCYASTPVDHDMSLLLFSNLNQHLPSTITIHVQPFASNEWTPFPVNSKGFPDFGKIEKNSHYSMTTDTFKSALLELESNSKKREYYEAIKDQIVYYFDEYSIRDYFWEERGVFLYEDPKIVSRAVYMCATPSRESLRLVVESLENKIIFLENNPSLNIDRTIKDLTSELEKVRNELEYVSTLIETTFEEIQDNVSFCSLTPEEFVQNAETGTVSAYHQPDENHADQITKIKSLRSCHPTTYFAYINEHGEKVIAQGDSEVPLSEHTFDPKKTYVIFYCKDSVGGDFKEVSECIKQMHIETKYKESESTTNFVQYVRRLRGILSKCSYSISPSIDCNNLVDFRAHLDQNEEIFSNKITRVRIANEFASLREQLIKRYVLESLTFSADTHLFRNEEERSLANYGASLFSEKTAEIEVRLQERQLSSELLPTEELTRSINHSLLDVVSEEINSEIGKMKLRARAKTAQIMKQVNTSNLYQLPDETLFVLSTLLTNSLITPLAVYLRKDKLEKVSDSNSKKVTYTRITNIKERRSMTLLILKIARSEMKGNNKVTNGKILLKDIFYEFSKHIIKAPLNIGNPSTKIKTILRKFFDGLIQLDKYQKDHDLVLFNSMLDSQFDKVQKTMLKLGFYLKETASVRELAPTLVSACENLNFSEPHGLSDTGSGILTPQQLEELSAIREMEKYKKIPQHLRNTIEREDHRTMESLVKLSIYFDNSPSLQNLAPSMSSLYKRIELPDMSTLEDELSNIARHKKFEDLNEKVQDTITLHISLFSAKKNECPGIFYKHYLIETLSRFLADHMIKDSYKDIIGLPPRTFKQSSGYPTLLESHFFSQLADEADAVTKGNYLFNHVQEVVDSLQNDPTSRYLCNSLEFWLRKYEENEEKITQLTEQS